MSSAQADSLGGGTIGSSRPSALTSDNAFNENGQVQTYRRFSHNEDNQQLNIRH